MVYIVVAKVINNFLGVTMYGNVFDGVGKLIILLLICIVGVSFIVGSYFQETIAKDKSYDARRYECKNVNYDQYGNPTVFIVKKVSNGE